MPHLSRYGRKLARARTEQQFLSKVQILRGALGELDENTGRVGGIHNAKVIYSGTARVRTINPSTLTLGEGVIATRSTTISIPISHKPVPRRDDLVKVIDNDSDDDLDARWFRVTDVDGGGYIGDARRLSCTSWAESRYWEGAQ